MARVPLDHPRSMFVRFMSAYSRHKYGDVLTPGLAIAHNRKVLWSLVKNERRVARWNALGPTLKALAVLAASAEVGCSWCIDFGYWEFHNAGVAPEKLRSIGEWQHADVYSDLERQVIAFSIAMTQTPPEVTDSMVEALRSQLSDAAVVELTAMVALENSRSRTNAALGIPSQGFREACELAAAPGGLTTAGP